MARDQFNLHGKIAVVAGASRGIGAEVAAILGEYGAQVICLSRGADGCADTLREIAARGGRGEMRACHIGRMEQIEGFYAWLDATHGRVDILVNNAGILRDKTLIKTEEPDWDAVISVHLKGTYCVTRPIFTHMKERGGGGVIVNTSSTSGLIGNFGQCNYGAAKAGIAGFTRCLAQEGSKYGIRVWGLAPVAFTRLTEDLMGGAAAEQSKQALDPAKVSQAVLYMVSDLSGSRTGQFLFVSGARVAELKIVGPEGMKKEGFTARDIADNEAAVFLPKESGFNMYG